jgi:hypothetical protein
MTYEIVSTESWNVLGTFDDETAAREATWVSLADRGASVGNLVVYVSPEHGPVRELSGHALAKWAGIDGPSHAQDQPA